MADPRPWWETGIRPEPFGTLAPQAPPENALAQALSEFQRRGGMSGLLPKEPRERLAHALTLAGELSPGAGVRDFLQSSGDLTRNVVAGNPWGSLVAGAGMALGAVGAVPGGGVMDDVAKGVGKAAGTVTKAGALADALTPMRAYHASPYDFDKFDFSKIGTGEGAQAFGHGGYFAGHEPTMEEYWRQFQNHPALMERQKEIAARLAAADDKAYKLAQVGGPEAKAAFEEWLKINGEWNRAVKPTRYEVNIHADPNKMLDWDKPVGAQPAWKELRESPKVRDWATAEHFGYSPSDFAALPAERQAYLRNKTPPYVVDQMARSRGGEYQAKLGEHLGGGEQAAAAALREAGIPGIKYLDQGSRGAGAGTHNYVIFDDKYVDIIRKYGLIPVAVAGGGYMALTPEQAQAQGITP
jgi:hypothetical protein